MSLKGVNHNSGKVHSLNDVQLKLNIMHNPRIYHLRDEHNHVLASAEVIFDLQQNIHHMEVTKTEDQKSIHFEYENPADALRYIKMSVIELGLNGYDHYIEEAMPV